MRTIAVLGGGIGGLSASYYLSKSPQVTKVIVLEASSRFGGWLWSTRRSDGAVFELGPRGIRPAGAVGRNTLNMVEDLGLQEEVLPVSYSHVASKNRFLYINKQLHRMPSGLGGVLRTVPPFSRPLLLTVAMEMLVRRGKEEDESVHSFVSRRLGQELADLAIDSLCRGVFAGDCRKLSVRSCFPLLYNAEQTRGSIVLGMLLGTGPSPVVPPGPLAQRASNESWAQWSLRRGIESLPEAITDWLAQNDRVELHRHAPVKQLHPSASGWEIQLEDGTVSADHIISALPAKGKSWSGQAGLLLERTNWTALSFFPSHLDTLALASALPSSLLPLSLQLQEIASVTVAVVNLEYEGSVLPVTGFGHLVPSSEETGLLGVVYDSIPFPQHDRPSGGATRLTVMMGGAWFQEVFGSPEEVTEEHLLATATEAIHRHLGITKAASWSMVTIHRDCIPQYYLGHWKRVESMRCFIKDKSLPLSLAGSSFDGVSVNDVIFSGRTAAEGLLGPGV